MNISQFNELKRCKTIYDVYKQVGTVNGANPMLGDINNVYKELYGNNFDTSCGTCIAYALEQVYRDYESFKQNQG